MRLIQGLVSMVGGWWWWGAPEGSGDVGRLADRERLARFADDDRDSFHGFAPGKVKEVIVTSRTGVGPGALVHVLLVSNHDSFHGGEAGDLAGFGVANREGTHAGDAQEEHVQRSLWAAEWGTVCPR